MEPVLQAVDISRRFGEYQALKPTHFDLSPGQTVILSGPNGAGKSTLLCLSGLLAPTTGFVHVDNHDLYLGTNRPRAARWLTCQMCRVFYPRTDRLGAPVTLCALGASCSGWGGLSSAPSACCATLACGKRATFSARLFARNAPQAGGWPLALIRPLKVLLLDEPSSALDANFYRRFWRIS